MASAFFFFLIGFGLTFPPNPVEQVQHRALFFWNMLPMLAMSSLVAPAESSRERLKTSNPVLEVVLPAGCADNYGERETGIAGVCPILARQKQRWFACRWIEGYLSACNAAHKVVNNWSEQRASLVSCGGSECEPGKDLLFRNKVFSEWA